MKKTELIFNLFSIPMDAFAIAAAGVVSFYLRFNATELFGPVLFTLPFLDFVLIIAKAVPILLIIFALLGLYSQRGTRRFTYEFNRIIVGTSLATLFIVILFFFDQSLFPSRFIILVAWILSIVFLLSFRIILKLVQRALFSQGYGLHKLVLINGNGLEANIIRKVLAQHRYGYQIVGELQNTDRLLTELEEISNSKTVDEIIQTDHTTTAAKNLELVTFARRKGLAFSFVPNLFEVQRNIIELSNLNGVPIISLKNTPLDGWGRVTKRILDIVISSACLIIVSPIFLILAILIKLDSPGPVVYGATRVGRGKNFSFYKLRSMFTHLSVGEKYGKEDAEKLLEELITSNAENRVGPLHKIKNDPRVTRIGRFIRRTKLDEIPQFWNVLKGDMSMVGPRPHLPEQVESYKSVNGRVLSIKPGIFGLTQIAQTTWPTLPFEEEIRLDIYYIENWSVWLDITTLARSFVVLFWSKKPEDNY